MKMTKLNGLQNVGSFHIASTLNQLTAKPIFLRV